MTAVTLRWEDPDDAAEFLRIRADYLRDGWLSDPASAALLELLGSSEAVRDDD